MIATYLNRYEDGVSIYYDLSFDENGETLLRLSGVIFPISSTIPDMEARASEIASSNLQEYQLNEIIFL